MSGGALMVHYIGTIVLIGVFLVVIIASMLKVSCMDKFTSKLQAAQAPLGQALFFACCGIIFWQKGPVVSIGELKTVCKAGSYVEYGKYFRAANCEMRDTIFSLNIIIWVFALILLILQFV